MSDKKLSLLGILAAASIVLAVGVSQFANRTKPVSPAQGNLIQGLDPANIAEIVAGKGAQQINLKRREKGFVVANKSFYPASNRAINDLLASCLDIRIVELYTQDKANYKDLGVTEENAKDIVRFLDANGKLITGFIIGNIRPDGQMAYARLIDDDKVYVILNTPWVKSSPMDYIEQELVSADKTNIETVTVTSPKEVYALTSEPNSTEVVLDKLPAGKKEKKDRCDAVFAALTSLTFDDVNSASDVKDLNFDRQYRCLLKDSTLYVVDIAQKDSQTFIKCGAEFTDKTPVTKEQAVESQQELKKKEAKFLAKEKAKKFQDTVEGWIYLIPEYKAETMTKSLAQIVENIAETNETKKEELTEN